MVGDTCIRSVTGLRVSVGLYDMWVCVWGSVCECAPLNGSLYVTSHHTHTETHSRCNPTNRGALSTIVQKRLFMLLSDSSPLTSGARRYGDANPAANRLI